MRRIFLVLAALAFVACMAVQLNDPDPAQWIAVYLAAAFVAGIEAAGRPRPVLPWALLGGALVWAGWLAVGLDAAALRRGFDDEVMRELGGLLLIAGAMGGLLLSRARADAPVAAPPGDIAGG